MEYAADVTLRLERPLKQDALEELPAVGGVAVGTPGKRGVEATLTVEAESVPRAAELAIARVTALIAGEPIAVSDATTEEYDRQMGGDLRSAC